ncbi:hypothetical protein LNTAR_25390 [Lentisphaera araneosa HTCC2155]|uniref:YgjP-like metallopeptidase domain-containing protein n=1 Tax=Lentisphaera araneosa HTCC2155 TaxID=313628 RepID=A6DSC0_9BACT|nr:SprT family zinc-dependent metalloprotease [Lentisphaera araneosa]EDM25465.1 hypothetical protein LNTAR_25390 [Lentisphaera araneosa HTCC2155]
MIHSVLYGEEKIHFECCYISEAKLKFEVKNNESVLVSCPEGTPLNIVKNKVLKRARWIIKQVHDIRLHNQDVRPRKYISGECHFYLGRRYVLKVVESDDKFVKMWRGKLEVYCRSSLDVKTLLAAWYKVKAESYFHSRLKEISTLLPWTRQGLPKMRLLSMQKQWGSCSPSGDIVLNPHLVKAPRECVDYVILHELCHLEEHNHSPRFYQLLGQLMPNWKEIKPKLDAMAEVYLNV